MEIKQFAESVVNFSSQYGTAGSSSYTASNLAGSLRVYDRYGDFTEAFVLVRISVYLSSLCVCLLREDSLVGSELTI